MTKPTVSDERLAEMVGAGMPCVPIMAGEVAQIVQELRQRRAQQIAPVELHGPYGWLNGHRALNEENWTLEMDPLENSEEYFAIPLYALSDPFKEIGRAGPPAALTTPKPEAVGDQCDKCHRRYTAVYNVPNDLWTKIAPKPETLGDYPEHQYGGLLCPDCATNAAKALGVELVLVTQPPTPASGEQMEVVEQIKGELLWAFKKWQHSHTAEELVQTILESPALSKALVILTAANERAERLERERDDAIDRAELARENEDDGLAWEALKLCKARAETAEALNTTLSEALERLENDGKEFLEAAEAVFDWMNGNDLSADHEEQKPDDFKRVSEALVAFRTALAALPAKQGGQS